jgi:hypothetical protein
MEIQTEFIDAYTNKIDKLLNYSNNYKITYELKLLNS